MYLIDSDHITIIRRRTQPEYGNIARRMSSLPSAAFFASIVSFHEQVLGANAFVNRARQAADFIRGYRFFYEILDWYCQVQVLPFDAASVATYDGLRAQRVRIGTMDLRIASIALQHGMTVLSRNLTDFRKVPGLTVEDWTL